MKKIGLFAFVVFFVANSAHAQFYFRAGLGLAFPQAGQSIDGNSTPYNGSRNTTTYTSTYNVKTASFSSGFQSVLGGGYMFSDHIGVQLDASIGISNTKYTFTDENITISGYQANESLVQHANTPVMLMPSLVLQSGGNNNLNVYSRFGLALPLISRITQDDIYDVTVFQPAVIVDYTSKIKSSFSLGFAAAAGVQYKISDKTTLWGEVNVLSLSLYIKQFDLVGYTQDGVSIPLDSIKGPHTIKFSKNVVIDTNSTHFPAYSQPFSNVGVMIGVTFRLSAKNSRSREEFDEKDRNFKRKKF